MFLPHSLRPRRRMSFAVAARARRILDAESIPRAGSNTIIDRAEGINAWATALSNGEKRTASIREEMP